MIFNIDNGYLEGLVRGFRSGILTRTDYLNLIQCETLEGNIIVGFVYFYKCRVVSPIYYHLDYVLFWGLEPFYNVSS